MKVNAKILIAFGVVIVALFLILEKFTSDSPDSPHLQNDRAIDGNSYDQKEVLIKNLRQRIADLENQLQHLEVVQSIKEGKSSRIGDEIDRKDLEKIKFPDNPTKENLKIYALAILEISKNQGGFSYEHPQVEMLKKLGKKNVDILVGLLAESSPSAYYLGYAIKDLATEQDKDLILREIPNHEELIMVAHKYGWQNEIKDLIINKLEAETHLRRDWIYAAASLKDPKANEKLIQYFQQSQYPAETYHMLSHFPDIKLTEEHIAKAWEKARIGSGSFGESMLMANIAAAYGRVDAFDFLIKNLDSSQITYEKQRILEGIYKTTGMSGSPKALQQWYEQVKGRLVFDPGTRRFQVR